MHLKLDVRCLALGSLQLEPITLNSYTEKPLSNFEYFILTDKTQVIWT